MFRSDPTERTDSTLPTTGAGAGVLQHLSRWKTGDPQCPDRDRRPVPPLGYKSFREVGCTDRRGSAGAAARRFRAAVLAKDRSRSCGRNSESSRTRSHPGCHWRKAEPMPSSGTEAALGESIQFLSQRPTLGAHVCPHVSLLSFLRPSMPESASLAALRMQQQGITFRQCKNAFLRCSDPERLQQLADSLTAQDLLHCGQKWLNAFTPFFTSQERRQAGCQHRLFFSQVELCDNLIFFRRAAVDQFAERLLDMNRTIGQPKKITLIFGRKVTRQYKGKLQTELEDLDLPNPVIRSHYAHGFAKQYVRDDRLLRTEPATNDVTDYGVKKNVENLPLLSQRMSETIDHYHDPQQDILETFIDRGQFQKLAEPTTLTNGKRIPGLKLDHPRQLAVMHALVRYANIAAGSTFTTADLYPPVLDALGLPQSQYSLASLRYDLSKLRAKDLLEKLPHSRRYRLAHKGYSICVLFLKLFERIYAPLTAGLLKPFSSDRNLAEDKRCQLDRLYQRLTDDLDALFSAVGLKTAA